MRLRIGSTSGQPLSLAGKIGGSLFFGVFLGMGLLFTGLLLHQAKEIASTYRWDKVPCVILSSTAEVDRTAKSDEDAYVVRLRYRYSIGAATYESDRFTLSSSRRYSSFDKANAVASKYPADASSVCYVNPNDPTQAILTRDLGAVFFLPLPLIFVLIGAGGIYAMWAPARPASKTLKDTKKSPKVGAWFGWVFIGVGGLVFWFIAAGPIANAIASRSWSEVPCQIISSRVQTHDGDDGDTYSVDILYRYEVDGRTYRSSRYNFIGGSSSGYNRKRDIVKKYAPGSTHTCFVDPGEPAKAVLVRSLGWGILLALIPLAFIGAGAAVVIGSRKAAKAPGRPTSIAPAIGPVVLKPQASRLARFIGVLVFALIWNGIISIFARELWTDYQAGRLSIPHALFFVPFGLIGLGAVVFAGMTFLQLFNARATLQLEQPLRLGQSSELTWQFSGKTSSLHALRLELIGLEQATYRQGTNNRTERQEFHRQPLLQADDPRTFTTGRVTVEVSGDSVPSFDFGSNSIVWQLRLRGNIRFWPDVDETYDVPVLPLLPRNRTTLPAMTL